MSCPFPWDRNLWSCVGSGAWSIPGVAGLCWRGRGLSRLALGHPSPGSHHCCRAGASGLCPCAVPRLIIPGRRRRAAVPSPLRERRLPERILLRPPASLLRGLCVPALLCLFLRRAGPSPAAARLSKCRALSLCFRVMPKPPSLPFLCPVASAQLPPLISLPDHRHLHWIFSFWREEFSLRQGCWLQTRFLICFSLTPFPSPRLVHVGRLKTFWLRHEPCTGLALRGCSDQGGSPKIIPL